MFPGVAMADGRPPVWRTGLENCPLGRTKELLDELYEQERAAWEASPEGREEMDRVAREREAAGAAQARREETWSIRHPDESEEWIRVQPLPKAVIDFAAAHSWSSRTS